MRLRSASPSPRICSAFELRLGEQHGDVAVGLGADLLRAAGCPGRGIRRPRAGARSACADRPPGCSAPADRRGGCARRRPRCRRPAPRLSSCSRTRAISCARSSRTTWVSVASPSTRRSAALSRIESCELAPSIGADRLIELQRILDAVAREGIDHEPLLVGGDHLLRRVFQIEDALVDADHAVDQRHLEVQARLGDDAHRLAEPDHQRLLGLIDREQRRIADDQRDEDEDERRCRRRYRVSSGASRSARCGRGAGAGGRVSSLSGR